MSNTPQYEYAGFWIRICAMLLDTAALGLITLIAYFIIYGSSYFSTDDLPYSGVRFVIDWVLPAVLSVILWLNYSATPGKQILHLKIVDADTGNTLSTKQCVIRYLGYFLSTIPLCAGFMWIGLDSRKQGFHDKLANSIVVSDATKRIVTFKK